MISSPDKKLQLRVVRISPRHGEVVREWERLRILNLDDNGFVLAEVKLRQGEGYCWRCGGIAWDPDNTLEDCPHCGDSFN